MTDVMRSGAPRMTYISILVAAPFSHHGECCDAPRSPIPRASSPSASAPQHERGFDKTGYIIPVTPNASHVLLLLPLQAHYAGPSLPTIFPSYPYAQGNTHLRGASIRTLARTPQHITTTATQTRRRDGTASPS